MAEMMPLRFAIASSADLRDAAFDELRRAIVSAGGPNVAPLFLPNYVALFETLHLHVADVAWCPPLVARDLVRVAAADPIAVVKRHGVEHYYSAIVAHADAPVRTVADLSHARFGWVSRLSAAGYIVPRRHLASMGVTLKDTDERFFHTHAALARALLAGDVEVVATYAARTATSFRLPDALARHRILAAAGPIPGDVIVCSRRVGVDRQRLLARALRDVRIDPSGALSELLNASGFGPIAQDHFDALSRWFDTARDGAFRPFLR
jgi:ABC-type phosphate/phosphonate transport system substrate-binding protein